MTSPQQVGVYYRDETDAIQHVVLNANNLQPCPFGMVYQADNTGIQVMYPWNRILSVTSPTGVLYWAGV